MRPVPILVFCAACTGGSVPGEKLVVHASHTALAAVRTGETWKPLDLDAGGDAVLEIDGPTQIATVCDDQDFFNFYTIHAGPGVEALDMSCFDPRASTVVVDIDAPSTTQVWIKTSTTFGADQLTLTPGTYDVVAVDTATTPPRFEIRRDVAITGNLTLQFDLARTGVAMVGTRVDVTNASAGESVSRFVNLVTKNRTFALMIASGPTVFVIPTLLPEDRHFVTAATSSETMGTRTARRPANGTTPVVLELPAFLATATAQYGAAPTLAWQGDPRFDSLYFSVNDGDFTILHDVHVLPEWIAAGGAATVVEIPDPRTIPGWQAAWTLPASPVGLEWYFSASHDTGEGQISASKRAAL